MESVFYKAEPFPLSRHGPVRGAEDRFIVHVEPPLACGSDRELWQWGCKGGCVVGLDVKKIQPARSAFNISSSLVYMEVNGGAAHTLPLAAWRIRRQVRSQDSVLLLERICALLLPATPVAGAQAVASRVSLLLSDIPCELQVYHGATALLVLQQLYEAGAETITLAESPDLPETDAQTQARIDQTDTPAIPLDPLPYLAFLANYPSPRLLQLFPYDLAQRYQCVPLGTERNMLTLATCHWLNREVVAQLHTATQREIFQVRCEITIIDEVLHYWQTSLELETNKACSSSR